MFRKLIIIPCLAGFTFLTSTSVAGGCNFAPENNEVIGTIGGNTTKINEGVMETNKRIVDLTKALENTISGLSSSEQQRNEQLAKNIEAIIKRNEEAKNAAQSQRRISAQGYNPCSGRDVASAAASGSKAAGKVREQSNNEAAKDGEGTKKDETEANDGIRKTVQDGPLKTEVPVGHDFFPEDGLIDSANTRKVEDEITLMIDPYPNPKITDEESMAGVQGKIEQRVKQSRLAIASDTLRAVKTDSDATMSADLLKEYIKTGKLPEHVKVPTDSKNMTSLSVLYRVVGKQARFENPNWFQEMNTNTDELAMLKELVTMQAIQLAIAVDNREWMKRIAALLAEQVAMQTQETSNAKVKASMFAPGETPIGTK